MIDKYFQRPVFWDFSLGVIISSATMLVLRNFNFCIPKDEIILALVSDLSTVSLTLTGFILTLLTVLISFKSTAKPKSDIEIESDTLYEIFYSTSLYFESVKHLKNAIISLTTIAIVGYTLKLTLSSNYYTILFTYNILSLLIIFFTLVRCLLILSKIVKLQKDHQEAA